MIVDNMREKDRKGGVLMLIYRKEQGKNGKNTEPVWVNDIGNQERSKGREKV